MAPGYCRTLDCIFDAIFDPAYDEWIAVKVYRDGNPIELARFPTQEEAEDFAGAECTRELEENGQFGVGASGAPSPEDTSSNSFCAFSTSMSSAPNVWSRKAS